MIFRPFREDQGTAISGTSPLSLSKRAKGFRPRDIGVQARETCRIILHAVPFSIYTEPPEKEPQPESKEHEAWGAWMEKS